MGFEAVLKVVTLMFFGPLIAWIFEGIMSLMGYTYLAFDNLMAFLWNPMTLVLLVGLIIFIALYTLFDIITVIVILNQSCQGKTVRVIEAIVVSLKKCRGILRLENLGFLGWVILVMPFISVGVATSFLTTLRVPSFILEFIWQNRWLTALVVSVIVIWLVVLVKVIYALHYYVIENKNFMQAMRASIKLNKKTWWQDLLILMATQVLVTVAYLLVTAVGILALMLVARIWGGTLANEMVVGAIWVLITIMFVLGVIFALPICFAMISVLFYRHQGKQQAVELQIEVKRGKKAERRDQQVTGVIGILIMLAILECVVFNYRFRRGDYNAVLTQLVGTEVTAHRGASAVFPENTMKAFEEASRLGADYIELDVQETCDGEIVVVHDRNLARLAGVKKNVDEMTWAEIQELEVGSHFKEEFWGEKIPTLKEAVVFAKEAGIKLNIELKTMGREDLVQKVMDVVNEEEFQNNVVISSTLYELLQQVEEKDSRFVTIYVMGMMYGDVLPLQAADGFSLEASNVTLDFINAAHEAGKVVYAWTVNSEDKIWRMVELGVDNIVTDDVTLAKEVISQSRTSGFVNEYVRLIRGLLWW